MANPKLRDYSLDRMTRGAILAKENVIAENGDGSFSVPSQTVEEILYIVRLVNGAFECNCGDFRARHEEIGLCYHAHAVKFWIAQQVEIKQAPKPQIFADDSIQCDKCGSIRVIKFGVRGNKQAYRCKGCLHKFTPSLLKKAKYSPEVVSLCLDLYFSGDSLAKTARILNSQFGTKVTKVTIYRWIQKFIPKISGYVNSLSPQLSEVWHFDELFVKMKKGTKVKNRGRVAFVWNAMDRKTRFLLASKLTSDRDVIGATFAFDEALKNAHGQVPETVTTDSLRSYKAAFELAFNNLPVKPKLITNVGIRTNKPHPNNNRIERLNGTLRERVKVQRGAKSFASQITEGMRIQYNFVKPHEALEGQTPAQRAGIGVDSKNKWLSLLELALTNQSETSRKN